MNSYNTAYNYHQTPMRQLASPHLTKREIEVLKFALQGDTAKRIGLKLRISNRTVEKHLEVLRQKMNCHTKTALIYACINNPILREKIFEEN